MPTTTTDQNLCIWIGGCAMVAVVLMTMIKGWVRDWFGTPAVRKGTAAPHPFRVEEQLLLFVAGCVLVYSVVVFGLTDSMGVYERAGDSVRVQLSRPLGYAVAIGGLTLYLAWWALETGIVVALCSLLAVAAFVLEAWALSMLHTTDPANTISIPRHRYGWLLPYFFGIGLYGVSMLVYWSGRMKTSSFAALIERTRGIKVARGDLKVIQRGYHLAAGYLNVCVLIIMMLFGLSPELGAQISLLHANIAFSFMDLFAVTFVLFAVAFNVPQWFCEKILGMPFTGSGENGAPTLPIAARPKPASVRDEYTLGGGGTMK